MNPPQPDDDLVGSRWKINDSGTEFTVIDITHQYAVVENTTPPARRRRILLRSLRTSRARTGYTQLPTSQR